MALYIILAIERGVNMQLGDISSDYTLDSIFKTMSTTPPKTNDWSVVSAGVPAFVKKAPVKTAATPAKTAKTQPNMFTAPVINYSTPSGGVDNVANSFNIAPVPFSLDRGGFTNAPSTKTSDDRISAPSVPKPHWYKDKTTLLIAGGGLALIAASFMMRGKK